MRVRHGVGDGSDIGRIKRQQAFIGALVAKVLSSGTLTRFDRLVRFLNAATKGLTTDIASIKDMAKVGLQFQDIGLKRIRFITVPVRLQHRPARPGRVDRGRRRPCGTASTTTSRSASCATARSAPTRCRAAARVRLRQQLDDRSPSDDESSSSTPRRPTPTRPSTTESPSDGESSSTASPSDGATDDSSDGVDATSDDLDFAGLCS